MFVWGKARANCSRPTSTQHSPSGHPSSPRLYPRYVHRHLDLFTLICQGPLLYQLPWWPQQRWIGCWQWGSGLGSWWRWMPVLRQEGKGTPGPLRPAVFAQTPFGG